MKENPKQTLSDNRTVDMIKAYLVKLNSYYIFNLHLKAQEEEVIFNSSLEQ